MGIMGYRGMRDIVQLGVEQSTGPSMARTVYDDNADQLDIVEVKSGQTVAADAFSSPQKIAAQLQEIKNCHHDLIYGGNARQNRTSATVLPWNHVDQHRWT
jgi:hypothetical protein